MKSIKEFVSNILPADKWLKLSQVNNSSVVIAALYAIVYFGAKLHGINIPNGLLSTVSISTVSSVIGNGATSLIKNIVKKGKASPEEIQEILDDINQRTDKNIELSKKLLELDKELLKNEDFEKSISQLSESLHIDINNLKNEINGKLDEIKEELRIVSSSNIERMETALCKDPESSSVCSGANEPELFRPTGPMWIDFKGITKRKDSEKKTEKKIVYVAEREEVGEIIDKVKNSNEDIIIIKGKPASGKSVVLRSIGYHLINDGFTVYYIQLKFFQSVEVLEFNKIRHGIVIVDDAHLNIELTEKLIRNKSKEIKLIIGTRDIKNYKPDSEAHFPELLKSAITIQAVDAAEKIIDKFNEIHHNILNESVKNEILKKSGNNLWILAWRLKAYKRFKNTNPESLYLILREHISGIHNLKHIYYDRGMEDALYILSVFYRYEIPLRRPYVESFTNEEVIRKLAQLSEVLLSESREGDYLSLHHSEIAKVYFETFEYFADFGYAAKKKVKELAEKYGLDSLQNALKIDASLITGYTETFPEEFNRFIGQVPGNIQDTILQNKYFLNLIPKIFKNYQPFDDFIVWFFYSKRLIPKIRRNKNLKSKIDTIDPSVFEEKARKWDNPWHIGGLLEALKWVKYQRLNEISKAVFEEKVRKWDNPRDIGYLLKALKKVKYERLNETLEDIKPKTLEKKIRGWNDPRDIGDLLKALKWVKYERLNELLEGIGPEVFEEKVMLWDDKNDNEHLEQTLKELHYPHLEKLKELLGPAGLWLID